MNRRLFVYGTLIASHGHPQGNRLRAEALLLGPATIAGRLYRISWYPGLGAPLASGDVVHGEVYELADPDRTWLWLDEYEGITAGATSAAGPEAYERVERDVTLADGSRRRVLVYHYRLPPPERGLIPDGIWRG